MAKKEFPEIKEKNEGKFTKWVEKNMSGMDTCKAASKVMKSRTKKYSPAVVKMANYANNFGCKTKREDGTSVPLKGKQKNLPDALKSKILASDGASMKKPRGTKEEMAQRKVDKRNARVEKRSDRDSDKFNKGIRKIVKKHEKGKITGDLAREKLLNSNSDKKLNKARFIRGSKEQAKAIAKSKK